MLDITLLNAVIDVTAVRHAIVAGGVALAVLLLVQWGVRHLAVADGASRDASLAIAGAMAIALASIAMIGLIANPSAAFWRGATNVVIIFAGLACVTVAGPAEVRRLGGQAAVALLVVASALSVTWNMARLDEAPGLIPTLEGAYGIEDVRLDETAGVDPLAPQSNDAGVRYIGVTWRVRAGHRVISGQPASKTDEAMRGTLVIDDASHVHLATGPAAGDEPLIIARGDGPTWRASLTS